MTKRDLVERLRETCFDDRCAERDEAANEIESLRAALLRSEPVGEPVACGEPTYVDHPLSNEWPCIIETGPCVLPRGHAGHCRPARPSVPPEGGEPERDRCRRCGRPVNTPGYCLAPGMTHDAEPAVVCHHPKLEVLVRRPQR